MNKKTFKNILKNTVAFIFWLAVWEIASLSVNDRLKLFLPGPEKVLKSFILLLPQHSFLAAAGSTLLRILIGFLLGAVTGIILGICTDSFLFFDTILSPMLRIIRAVPVVCFIILAYLFISVNRLPVFISFLMVVPLVWQSVNDSLKATDKRLIEMGRVFGLNKSQILFKIKLPKAKDNILTACVNGLGFAWKSGVAAEVLCTPSISLGRNVFHAKALLDFDEVYAITLTVVLLSLILETLLRYICKMYLEKKEAVRGD